MSTTIIENAFSWYDYTLFGLLLSFSTLIGIYYGFISKKKQNNDKEYLFGSNEMKVFPISMSLISSLISGTTLLTVPTEVYLYGIYFLMMNIGVVISIIGLCYIYLPVFYKMKLTSIYEYLEMRFDKKIRLISSFCYCGWMICLMPIVIYVPSLAFSRVTGFDVHLVTLLLSGICIFYTTIGGLKAVVWTDTLQLLSMIGGIFAVVIIGIIKIGGLGVLINNANEGDRLSMDFDLDPLKRDTFWAALFGLIVIASSIQIPHQSLIQKFLALPTLNDGRKAAFIFGIGFNLINGSSVLIGLIIYVTYHNRDPFTLGIVKKLDELLPYFVMDVAGNIPGLPGLFIAGIVSAALSTFSAVLNSLSATIYKDMVSPLIPEGKSERFISNVLKLIVVVMGIICTALVFIVEHLGGLLALQISLTSITKGPLLGIFTLGMVFPKANAKGGLFGMIGSTIIMSWIVFGSQYYKVKGYIKYPTKPLTSNNQTFYTIHTLHNLSDKDVFWLYKISHYYYVLLGFVITVIIGIIVSKFTEKDGKVVHPDLITPICHKFLSEDSKKLRYYSLEVALRVTNSEMKRTSHSTKSKEVS